SRRSFLLPALPRQTWPVHAELHQASVIDLSDIDGAPVRAAETEVAGRLAEHVDLLQDLPLRRQLDHAALAIARDIQVAVHVAAHAVEAVVVELLHQPLVLQAAVGANDEGPDVALHALVDIERLAVWTDLDAVGRAQAGGDEAYLAGRVNLPDLT